MAQKPTKVIDLQENQGIGWIHKPGNQAQKQLRHLPAKMKEKMFKPGTSGNPLGKPKGRTSLTTNIRQDIGRLLPGTPQFNSVATSLGLTPGKCTFGDMLARSLIIHASKGNPAAINQVWNRLEGAIKLDDDAKTNVKVQVVVVYE